MRYQNNLKKRLAMKTLTNQQKDADDPFQKRTEQAYAGLRLMSQQTRKRAFEDILKQRTFLAETHIIAISPSSE